MDAIVALVLIASTVGMVVSVAMLAIAAIGRHAARNASSKSSGSLNPAVMLLVTDQASGCDFTPSRSIKHDP
jgi:hypothetical protein